MVRKRSHKGDSSKLNGSENLQNGTKELQNGAETKYAYDRYSTGQLRNELRRKGLKTTGKKPALLNRLTSAEAMTANGDTLKRRITFAEPIAHPNGAGREMEETKLMLKRERESLVLWKRPLETVHCFLKELVYVSHSFMRRVFAYRKLVLLTSLVTVLVLVSSTISGPHQPVLKQIFKEGKWCLYWLGLGVLSSVGLGTGLHTFLLYLGPHIASVTLAAYECGALNFPEPPYPDQIICPEVNNVAWMTSLWNIMMKVKVEAVLWGAGTALGELPPYFMARASRLSGLDPDDEESDLKEFEELQKKSKENPESMTLVERAKFGMERLVNRVGFLGILACASVPNPLFDLAGITCGHFLIPFWTFFGATLIGKAVIKMMLQVIFVIVAFNEVLIAAALQYISHVPVVGAKLEEPFTNFLKNQKQRLHTRKAKLQQSQTSILQTAFDLLVFGMILYFVISIVNSMAQSYHKRISKDQKKAPSKRVSN